MSFSIAASFCPPSAWSDGDTHKPGGPGIAKGDVLVSKPGEGSGLARKNGHRVCLLDPSSPEVFTRVRLCVWS